MKLYTIQMNGMMIYTRAGNAAVALKRAADRFKESELIRSSFIIIKSEKINYQFFFVAEVPCDPPGAWKRQIVSEPFATNTEAQMALDGFRDQHPEYRFIRVTKAEKQS